jgi:site-specific recombinase XerD
MSDACDRFVADAKARKLREGSILKYEQAVKTLRTIDKTVRQVTVEDIRELRESWGISALTMQKRLETVRSFFRFCEDAEWCTGNPAKAVKAPKTDPEPTLPFSDEEISRILDALETKYLESHPFSNELTKKKIRALDCHAPFRDQNFRLRPATEGAHQ